MDNRNKSYFLRGEIFFIVIAIMLTALGLPTSVSAESSIPQTDQTPTAPLSKPASPAQPRYISGFGLDSSYTIFYEDRNDTLGCLSGSSRIYFNQTTSGPLGFSATSTATNICDTHFVVKNWPITISAITYAYRAWGAGTNSGSHNFYVSNDQVNWILAATFTFTHPSDGILYGFHDIVQLNGNYIGWVESAGGRTYIVWSDNGDENWTVIAEVGGAVAGAAPLNLYFFPGITGPKPSGNFVLMELDGQLTYAKLYLAGDYRGAYMAINRVAAQAATPALAEAAFMNPSNWTWRDGTTGLPSLADTVIASTKGSGGHDVREAWTVPMSDYHSDHVFLYTADYATGAKGLGCAGKNAACQVVIPIPAAPTPTTGPPAGTLLCSQNGGTVAKDNWTVIVPPGALPSCSYVTIESKNSGDGPAAPANLLSLGHLVEIRAHTQGGSSLTSFTPALQVCYTYSASELVKASYNPINFTIRTAPLAASSWNGLPTNIVPSKRLLCARVNHLSYFDVFLPILIIPATGFAPDKAVVLPEQTVDYTAMGDLWLEIPKIGVQMNIVGVPFQGNNWDVTWLGDDAGWLEGTAYPTWVGNSTILGHVWGAYNRPGPFVNLKQLWWGDEVIVHAGGAEYVYEVRSVQTVNPENTSLITKHEEYSWLTLITCRNYNQVTGEYDKRLVIRAVLVKVR